MSTLPHDPPDLGQAEFRAGLPPVPPRELDDAVRAFESATDAAGVARPARAELSDLCRQAAAFTAELFPGEVAVQVKNDPEIPSDLYFVFGVSAAGSVDDLAAKNDLWHRRVLRAEGDWHGLFRLAIRTH